MYPTERGSKLTAYKMRDVSAQYDKLVQDLSMA